MTAILWVYLVFFGSLCLFARDLCPRPWVESITSIYVVFIYFVSETVCPELYEWYAIDSEQVSGCTSPL